VANAGLIPASEDGYPGCGIGDVEPCEDGGLPKPGGRDIRLSTALCDPVVDEVDMLCNAHSPPGLR
jgi:hypothetical protein